MISDISNSILTLHLGINTMVSISIGPIILPEIMYKMLTSEIFVWIDGFWEYKRMSEKNYFFHHQIKVKQITFLYFL